MATLLDLENEGLLLKVDPVLGVKQRETRFLYASQRLAGWIQNELPDLGSSWNIEVSPEEQLDALFAVYASGETLYFDWSFKPLVHIHDGVWELKTADVRVFGWFYRKDYFIGYVGNLSQIIKEHNLYHGYAGEVARFREQLELDEPKFVPGGEPDDVVSDWDYP